MQKREEGSTLPPKRRLYIVWPLLPTSYSRSLYGCGKDLVWFPARVVDRNTPNGSKLLMLLQRDLPHPYTGGGTKLRIPLCVECRSVVAVLRPVSVADQMFKTN